MDITVTLLPDAERFVRQEAENRGIAPEALAESVVATAFERERKVAHARALLQSWDDDGDETEQREPFESIAKGLNTGREGYRQHIPAHLKGKTW
jgi:hypothetical protein